MKSITRLLFLLSHLLLFTQAQKINSPTEYPDDYAEAVTKLTQDIGDDTPRAPKRKLHKRADLDELKTLYSQIDERRMKKRPQIPDLDDLKTRRKALKGEFTPEEIATKTDEELRQAYYARQKEIHSRMDEMYQKTLDVLKGELSDDEREKHVKKRSMIEKRKARMLGDKEKGAQRVSMLCSLTRRYIFLSRIERHSSTHPVCSALLCV